MRTRHLCILPVAAMTLLAACDLEEFAGSSRFKEEFHYSYKLNSGGRLAVESFNGSIEIQGWDKEEVEINGTRYASTKDLLSALKIDIVQSDDAVRIRTVRPSGRRGNMGASYVIHAPQQVELERIDTSNGRIHVEGIEGNARLRTSNGRVHVARLQGDVEVTTSNGRVELVETSGSAVLRTSNGSIKADGVRGHFEARTSNASIDAHLLEAGGSRPMKLHTSNGSVKLTMEQTPAGDIHASTNNGSITLYAPASLEVQLKADTSHGSISTEFDVVGGVVKKTKLEGAVGGGGPLLELDTSNGSIKLLKL